MAIFGVSNQLLQIDTGKALTYLYNQTSAFAPWAGLGENQVLGQRYFGVSNSTAVNPSGAPAIYMLVKYLSTSATTTANLTTAGAPAPVYWTDETYTTVSGIESEGSGLGINSVAGYMMVNTVTGVGLSGTALTAALLLGAQVLIQVGGYLPGAYGPTAGTAGAGAAIVGSAGSFTSTAVTAGTAPTGRTFGYQVTAIASGLCDVLVNSDII